MKNLSYLFILLLALLNINTLIAQHTISGQITCMAGGELSGQEVVLSGSNISDVIVTTDANGNYNFTNVPAGNDYTITIEKEDGDWGGITTFDIIVGVKHILGVQPFTTPFQQLAADVNNDGSVSTLDLVFMRQLILNLTNTFPGGQFYLFATSDYDPAAGTGAVAPLNISDLQEDLTIDFVQVKLGDLNGSATCD